MFAARGWWEVFLRNASRTYLAGGIIESEADQVGAFAGIESALARRHPADPRRIASGQRNGVAQAETGGPHDVRIA